MTLKYSTYRNKYTLDHERHGSSHRMEGPARIVSTIVQGEGIRYMLFYYRYSDRVCDSVIKE